jgi:hypothetical protein
MVKKEGGHIKVPGLLKEESWATLSATHVAEPVDPTGTLRSGSLMLPRLEIKHGKESPDRA